MGQRVSNDKFLLVEVLAKCRGSAALVLAEQTVEVGERVEAAVVTNLGYHLSGVNQHSSGDAQPDFDDVFRE